MGDRVIVSGFDSRGRHFMSVCNQPPVVDSTSQPYPLWDGKISTNKGGAALWLWSKGNWIWLNCRYKSPAVAETGDRLTTIDNGRKWGLLCPFPWGKLGPRLTQCDLWAETYIRRPTNWHLDPSNRLTSQTHRQDRQRYGRAYRAKRFTNGRPKTCVAISERFRKCIAGAL